MAESDYVELELARVEWWQWEMLGWPETSPATTLAVAGGGNPHLSAVPGPAGDEPRVNSGEFDPGLTV